MSRQTHRPARHVPTAEIPGRGEFIRDNAASLLAERDRYAGRLRAEVHRLSRKLAAVTPIYHRLIEAVADLLICAERSGRGCAEHTEPLRQLLRGQAAGREALARRRRA